ncbi:MAG: hypothetical protein JXR12_06015 [Neptunomonas phycophila]|uniref:hypothetical protein n=1 Tax=Neptunomonas phycophila TaxID=1572645 RepID=UPI003B8B61AE
MDVFKRLKVEVCIVILFVCFVVWFFGTIAQNGKASNAKVNAFQQECFNKNGIAVQLGTGKGWPKYICLDQAAVIPMGDLEYSLVKYDKGNNK